MFMSQPPHEGPNATPAEGLPVVPIESAAGGLAVGAESQTPIAATAEQLADFDRTREGVLIAQYDRELGSHLGYVQEHLLAPSVAARGPEGTRVDYRPAETSAEPTAVEIDAYYAKHRISLESGSEHGEAPIRLADLSLVKNHVTALREAAGTAPGGQSLPNAIAHMLRTQARAAATQIGMMRAEVAGVRHAMATNDNLRFGKPLNVPHGSNDEGVQRLDSGWHIARILPNGQLVMNKPITPNVSDALVISAQDLARANPVEAQPAVSTKQTEREAAQQTFETENPLGQRYATRRDELTRLADDVTSYASGNNAIRPGIRARADAYTQRFGLPSIDWEEIETGGGFVNGGLTETASTIASWQQALNDSERMAMHHTDVTAGTLVHLDVDAQSRPVGPLQWRVVTVSPRGDLICRWAGDPAEANQHPDRFANPLLVFSGNSQIPVRGRDLPTH